MNDHARNVRAAAPAWRTRLRQRLVVANITMVIAAIGLVLLLAPKRSTVVTGLGPTTTPAPTDSIPTATPEPQTPAATPAPVIVIATPTVAVINRGGVLSQIAETLRLETEIVVGERIIEADRLTGTWKDALYGEQILLIASGTTIAGVDLRKVRAEDVTISPDGREITLNLPATEILVNTLDNARTHRYSTRRGWLADNPDLETEARRRGEQEILTAACEAGILERAARSIQVGLSGFLYTLRFERVTINVPSGPCVAPQPNPEPSIDGASQS